MRSQYGGPTMSCDSVRQWKEFCEKIVGQETPQDWPHITCAEDLVIAAKAVRKSFRHSVSLLTQDGKSINAFDVRKYGRHVWYRGESHREPNWPLCPAVFRDDFYLNGVNGFRSAEKWTITEFWRKAVLRSRHCPQPERSLAWLALAQHHRLPTRLMDWSESISTAAWFATHDDPETALRIQREEIVHKLIALVAEETKNNPSLMNRATDLIRPIPAQGSTETVIWALSPALLNWHFNDRNGAFIFLENQHVIVMDAFSGEQRCPAIWAIWVQDVHPRMMSQSAHFTIHGTNESLENINNRLSGKERFLRKLIVDPGARSQILQGLADSGVTASSVFPDLDHLAAEIAEQWKAIVSSVKAGDSTDLPT